MTNYAGKLVRVTKNITDPAKHNSYDDGQYFVLEHLGDCITCIKLGASDSYDAGLTKSFVIGDEGGECKARAVKEDPAKIAKSARVTIKQAEETMSGKGKKTWNYGVYERAIFTANRILELVEGEGAAEAKSLATESVVVGGMKITIHIEKA